MGGGEGFGGGGGGAISLSSGGELSPCVWSVAAMLLSTLKLNQDILSGGEERLWTL